MKALIKTVLHRCGLDVSRVSSRPDKTIPPDFEPWIVDIVRRVQPFTYTSPERINAVCQSVEYLRAARIPGSLVECGVWKGGSMMAALLTLARSGELDREIWLYDTFEGMSMPTQADISIDGKNAVEVF